MNAAKRRVVTAVLSIAGLTMLTQPASAETIYVDFNNSASASGLYPSGPATWNVVGSYAISSFGVLADSAGTPTTIGLKISNAFSGATATGGNWNDASIPWAVSGAVSDYFFEQNGSMAEIILTNMTAVAYQISLLGSRETSGNRDGIFKVNGADSDSGEGTTANYYSAYDDGFVGHKVMTWSNVTPDGNQEVKISMTARTSSHYAYLNAMKIELPTAPIIAVAPTNETRYAGQTATFTTMATGWEPLSIQWRTNGVDIVGGTNVSQSTGIVTAGDNNKQYQVVVSNAFGCVTSQVATLTVKGTTLYVDFGSGPLATGLFTGETVTWNSVNNIALGNYGTLVDFSGTPSTVGLAITDAFSAVAASGGGNGWNTVTVPWAVSNAVIDAIRATSGNPGTVKLTNCTAAAYTISVLGSATTTSARDGLYTINGINSDSGEGTAANYYSSYSDGYSGKKIMVWTGVAPNAQGEIELIVTGRDDGSLACLNAMKIEYEEGGGGTAPSITQHPTNATVVLGDAAKFTVAASGTMPLFYQWRTNGVDVSGATATNYITAAAMAEDDGKVFSVLVSNAWGSVLSGNATQIVVAATAPSITTQPADKTVRVGQTANFTVTAAGTPPLFYQWRTNGVEVSGATATNYTTWATALSDSGTLLSVVVTNTAGSVTSDDATLTVTAPLTVSMTLANNESVADGVLSGLNDAVIQVNQADGSTFWWADTDGNGAAEGDGDRVLAGLDMAGFDLTRTTDNIGIALNLHDGTSRGEIANGGSILTKRNAGASLTTGAITITNVTAISLNTISTEHYSGSTVGHSGAISIYDATDIAITNLQTGPGDGSVYSRRTGKITVTQTGDFRGGSVRSDSGGATAYSRGDISFTGGGVEAGSFAAEMLKSAGAWAGKITIQNYKGVAVGAGGIDSHCATTSNTDDRGGGVVTVQGIGVDGVMVSGDILSWMHAAYNSTYRNNIFITNIAGSVTLANIDTHAAVWDSNATVDSAGGSVTIQAAGHVTVSNIVTRFAGTNMVDASRNGGNISITSANGAVTVGSLDTQNRRNKSGCNAGDVSLTAYGDLKLIGASNTLWAAYGGTARGDLVLTTSAGSGGTIYAGDGTNDVLDLSQMNLAAFDSDSGESYIGGVLASFDTAQTNGAGTVSSPYATTQTVLRVPAGQTIRYPYKAGGLNDYLGGAVYQVADLAGVAGQGGLLKADLPPAGTAILLR